MAFPSISLKNRINLMEENQIIKPRKRKALLLNLNGKLTCKACKTETMERDRHGTDKYVKFCWKCMGCKSIYYACCCCDQLFSTPYNAKTHIKQIHDRSNTEEHYCHCEERNRLRDSSTLQNHPQPCTESDVEHAFESVLTNHGDTHQVMPPQLTIENNQLSNSGEIGGFDLPLEGNEHTVVGEEQDLSTCNSININQDSNNTNLNTNSNDTNNNQTTDQTTVSSNTPTSSSTDIPLPSDIYKKLHYYLSYRADETKPYELDAEIKKLLQPIETLVQSNDRKFLSKIKEFKNGCIFPFKSKKEFIIYQLERHMTNNQYDVMRYLMKIASMEEKDIDLSLELATENISQLLQSVNHISTCAPSVKTLYNRSQKIDLKNVTSKDLTFHPLSDSIARLFSSKFNCSCIHLTPMKAPQNKIISEYYQSEHFHQLYNEYQCFLLVLAYYSDDFPASDRLHFSYKNVGFYVRNSPLWYQRLLHDGYILWTISDVELKKILQYLTNDLKSNEKLIVWHEGFQRFISLWVILDTAITDSPELHDICFMKGLTGENSVCCKCKKKFCNCGTLGENCDKRTLLDRKQLITELYIQLELATTEKERYDLVVQFEKSTGYDFTLVIPWETINFDIYVKCCIEVMHVEFATSGCSRRIIKLIIDNLPEPNSIIFTERLATCLRLNISNMSCFHAQQWEDITKCSLILFKDLVTEDILDALEYHVMYISLLKSQLISDDIIELVELLFKKARQKLATIFKELIIKPNFHFQEEMVVSLKETKLSVCLAEAQIGEKINKVCKGPFERKFNCDWVFKQIIEQRMMLRQQIRNIEHYPERFISEWKHYPLKYYDKRINNLDQIDCVFNSTFKLSRGDYVRMVDCEEKIAKIISFKEKKYLNHNSNTYSNVVLLEVELFDIISNFRHCGLIKANHKIANWTLNTCSSATIVMIREEMKILMYYIPYL